MDKTEFREGKRINILYAMPDMFFFFMNLNYLETLHMCTNLISTFQRSECCLSRGGKCQFTVLEAEVVTRRKG